MTHLHGQIIDFEGPTSLDIIPSRNHYLNEKEVRHTDALIYSNASLDGYDAKSPIRELLFFPNSFKIIHERDDRIMQIKYLIFGILPDGRKAALILEGINIYFDVKKPSDMNIFEFTQTLNSISGENKWNMNYNKINMRSGKGYSAVSEDYFRLSFKASWVRKKALLYFIDILKWETFTDDVSHLERVVSRDTKFNWCSWNAIKRFKSYKRESVCKLPKVFRVDVMDIEEIDYDISDIPVLFNDKCITETWDIEAYTSTGDMPDPLIKSDIVFCIGKTYQFKDSQDSLLNVCLMTKHSKPHKDFLTIKCKNQKDLIRANAMITAKFMPEFIYGFNDSSFDWNFIIVKANAFGILPEIMECLNLSRDAKYEKSSHHEKTNTIKKWNCRSMNVKIQADLSRYAITLQTPSHINVDVRISLQKMISNMSDTKSSLKYYLTKYGLSNKDDMPIHKLFKIYRDSVDIKSIYTTLEERKIPIPKTLVDKREKNLEEMTDIAHYCVIDARRCHDLVLKVNIINDQREVSSIARVTLFDSFWYANSMKVQNLLVCKAS